MIYGHSPVAHNENGSPEKFGATGSRQAPQSSWKVLSEACRLELVERALSPANDRSRFTAAL